MDYKPNAYAFKDRQGYMRRDGRMYCPKHLTTTYDPQKYTKCYICFVEEKENSLKETVQ